ncbi:MAG: 16S rRNA (cytidine(1402)-2'-O)-methyltransferase [Gemmatimonadaceae bacterium]|nr:16S rRNA (cytidine(1402)-2'-O)-methyltransferase [Gemmatimonadaceae bacterium]
MTGAVVPGTLYLVATPIGHLGDCSPRAAEVLGGVDVVLAEDTRHTRPLLTHLGLSTPLEAVHAHNEGDVAARLVARLAAGGSAALVSDAGTPLVSDPGGTLVAAAIAAGVPVVPVPGPSAVLAALTGSGLPAVPFTFYGFLPRKGPERRDRIADLAALRHTAVVYEAPPRLGETLAELADAGLGGRRAVVARELTKKFEEFRRGTVDALAASFAVTPPRGEVVLVLEGAPPPPPADDAAVAAAVQALRASGQQARSIQRDLMDRFGLSRNAAYRAAHAEDA